MDTKCTCNWGAGIISLVLMSLGLFLIVQGFVVQFNSSYIAYVSLVWYFVGFVLLMAGKMAKYKAMGSCPMHCGSKMGMTMSANMPAKRSRRR